MKLPEYVIIKQDQSADNHSIRIKLHLTADLDFFDGHFEQMSILPAVAQLFIVKILSDRYFKVVGDFVGLRQLKFKSPITPQTEIEVLIEHQLSSENTPEQLQFTYMSLEQIKSKGVLIFDQVASS